MNFGLCWRIKRNFVVFQCWKLQIYFLDSSHGIWDVARSQQSDWKILEMYLWNVGIDLTIQSVSFFLNFLESRFGFLKSFLALSQRVHEFVAFVQHGNHQLFEVRILSRELRTSLADAVLRDGRHDVAHHVPHFASRGVNSHTRRIHWDLENPLRLTSSSFSKSCHWPEEILIFFNVFYAFRASFLSRLFFLLPKGVDLIFSSLRQARRSFRLLLDLDFWLVHCRALRYFFASFLPQKYSLLDGFIFLNLISCRKTFLFSQTRSKKGKKN